MKWRTYGQGEHKDHFASKGISDYRVRWSYPDGMWLAEICFELHGCMTPFRTLSRHRNGADAMNACETHAATL
jgi:hypothetical protein